MSRKTLWMSWGTGDVSLWGTMMAQMPWKVPFKDWGGLCFRDLGFLRCFRIVRLELHLW